MSKQALWYIVGLIIIGSLQADICQIGRRQLQGKRFGAVLSKFLRRAEVRGFFSKLQVQKFLECVENKYPTIAKREADVGASNLGNTISAIRLTADAANGNKNSIAFFSYLIGKDLVTVNTVLG
jgi:hypothetical protein